MSGPPIPAALLASLRPSQGFPALPPAGVPSQAGQAPSNGGHESKFFSSRDGAPAPGGAQAPSSASSVAMGSSGGSSTTTPTSSGRSWDGLAFKPLPMRKHTLSSSSGTQSMASSTTASSPATSHHASSPKPQPQQGLAETMFSWPKGLPTEALQLVFMHLHELDPTHGLHPCMLVCKSWYKHIIQDPKLWARLHVDLSVPARAQHRVDLFTRRFAGLESVQQEHDGKTVDGVMPPPLQATTKASCTDFAATFTDKCELFKQYSIAQVDAAYDSLLKHILNSVRDHLWKLEHFGIHINGDLPSHVRMAHRLMSICAPQPPSDTSLAYAKPGKKICQARRMMFALPFVRGIPLADNALAWFAGASDVTIFGGPVFPDNACELPSMPHTTPEFRQYMSYLSRALPIKAPQDFLDRVHRQHLKYQRDYKVYMQNFDLHKCWERQQELKWHWLHQPGSPHALYATTAAQSFHNLTSLTLRGCSISNSLAVPMTGFPKLKTLNIRQSKWGLGFWEFLRSTPYLENMIIEDLTFDADAGELPEADFPPPPSPPRRTPTPLDDDGGEYHSPTMSDLTVFDSQTPPYGTKNAGDRYPGYRPDSFTQTILSASSVTVLGDHDTPIAGFDDCDVYEHANAKDLYIDLADQIARWDDEDRMMDYPSDLRYPIEIDSAVALHVVTKPIFTEHWQYQYGLRYLHRVRAYDADRLLLDNDIPSEHTWQELQTLRGRHRSAQGLLPFVSDSAYSDDEDNDEIDEQQHRRPESVRPDVPLPLLKKLHVHGGSLAPIWAWSTASEAEGQTIPTMHPSMHMPNLEEVSLINDWNLYQTRVARPVPQLYREALGIENLQEGHAAHEARITSTEYESILDTFDRGIDPVIHELSDDQLFNKMDAEDYRYYSADPSLIPEFRHKWRGWSGLLDRKGKRDDRALLRLITGPVKPVPPPYALTALLASANTLLNLDLSYSNISAETFISAMQQAPALQRLALVGVTTLDNRSLMCLPKHCPALVSLDVTACSNIVPKGLVSLVVSYRDHVPGLRRIKLDDPHLSSGENQSRIFYHAQCAAYVLLEFLGVVVDEELEAWNMARKGGDQYSKGLGKKKMRE